MASPVPIPTSLNLGLRELRLSNNYFSGSLPKQLFSCSNLTILDLSSNSLSVPIPHQFASFSALDTLLILSNSFSGAIPPSVLALKSLSRFEADQNDFTGPIPIGITMNLKALNLSFNGLSGPLPADLLSPPSLESVDLTSNALSGSIPHNMSRRLFSVRLGELLDLYFLELDGNRLEGAIPTSLRNCTQLYVLSLANNSLQGEIPRELGELRLLVVLQLQMNRFNGSIPDELFQLKNLLSLNQPECAHRSDTIQDYRPAEARDTEPGREFSERVNPSIDRQSQFAARTLARSERIERRHPTLAVLDISDNGFTGDVPTFLTQVDILTTLDLSNNQLSGNLPTFPQDMRVNATGNKHLKLSDHRNGAVRRDSIVLVIVGAVLPKITDWRFHTDEDGFYLDGIRTKVGVII
ncbi:hypothetical protein QJS10_CPA08g01185 [Acorus calamus]|uniref:Uncharacterized protein n=1 Tax=Acorus calamus TaxID=4465 RepID=A0AAV9ECI3_ACOCL|nr:hypothetical protein QJS10_CPA08g01185 [Acorus calamus]